MPESEPLSYEDAIERLESLIEALEDGDIPLHDLVEKFEQGSNLLKLCQSHLKEAEAKIEKLNTQTGELEPLSD
jgi:exodeoxyribonuclease VII small subunit